MAVLIRHRAPMSTAQYDETAPPLVEQIKKQPGFLLHVSYEDASGFRRGRSMGDTGTARQLVRRQRQAERPA